MKSILIPPAQIDVSPETVGKYTLFFQIKKYLANFYGRLNLSNKKKPDNRFIEKASQRISSIIERNNYISRLMHSTSFEYIRVMKRGLTGAVTFGLGFCVDGRIARLYFGPAVSTWEVPAGQLSVEKRFSDGKLIPKSHDLCEGIKREVNPDKDLFELFLAHYDSTDPHHGCAAINLVLSNLKNPKSGVEEFELLAKKDIEKLLSFSKPEEANLYLIEKTSLEALTNFYNTCREQIGLAPLPQVGLAALFDTATAGIVLKNGDQILSTTELTNTYRKQIEKDFSQQVDRFSHYHKTFTNPEHFLDFSKAHLKLIELLLNPYTGLQYLQQVDQFVAVNYPKLTSRQVQALRFFVTRTVAFQYLTGLSDIKHSTHHPFTSHNEAYMAVSERGEFVGKFDTEQAFGSSAANIAVGIKQIKIEISVMNKFSNNKNKPYLLFVCNPISSSDFRSHAKGLQRARANNSNFVRSIIADPELGVMVKNGQLIMIPVLINDDTREVLQIVDHSAYI